MIINRLVIYLAIIFLSSCQTTSHLKPIQGGPVKELNLSSGEKRLWSMSDDAEQQIRRSGKILRNKDSQQYLNNILNRLFPEYVVNMKVIIIKRPILNAFAFPNGSIYIHTGIITAAKNEAQIASVIAHEGAHYILKHSAKSRINRSNMTSFIVMVNLMGIPLLGELIGISSISGYSQDLEREADLFGAKRLLKAGYDINESYKIFEFMASEAKANEVKEPFFFATHPRLLERIENFKDFASKNKSLTPGFGVNNNSYSKKITDVTKYATRKKLELGKYSSLINELTFNENQWENISSAEDKIIYAEAYRLRGKDGDLVKAKELLESIKLTEPNFWKPYFSFGVIALQEGNYKLAQDFLLKAKSLSKKENGYIKMYLNKIKKMEKTNE